MSYRKLDVVHLPLERWPFLNTSDSTAKLINLSSESMDDFFLALDAKPHSSPVLTWTASAGCVHGGWHPTIHG